MQRHTLPRAPHMQPHTFVRLLFDTRDDTYGLESSVKIHAFSTGEGWYKRRLLSNDMDDSGLGVNGIIGARAERRRSCLHIVFDNVICRDIDTPVFDFASMRAM